MRLLALSLLALALPAQATTLADLLYPDKAPPPHLRVLVIEYDAAGRPLARHHLGDPASVDWWPASTVKIFAAVAALEAVEALGFDQRAQVRFERPGRRPYTRRVGWLVQKAITDSSNLAYDRLVQFVGHDALHADLLGPARGLHDTALQVPYSTNVSSLLDSPAITLRHGKRSHTIPARQGDGTARCPLPTCTSLDSLAEIMRRVMLHASLPAQQRLRLSDAAIARLHAALAGRGKRGQEVVEAFDRAFRGRAPRLYHKPGYYPRWRSDVVFIEVGGRRWAIALANAGGRKALNDPAARLARWMARGASVAQ